MRSLFLDIASHQGLLACVTDDSIVASHAVDHRIDDREFVREIEKVLAAAQWQYADVTSVACVAGPGGFTSLRVGVAAANALSYALQIPSCGIHLSDLYAARSVGALHATPLRAGDVLWLHSTKKRELFVRGFGHHAKDFPEAVCMQADQLTSILKKDDAWMGELIPEHRAIVDDCGAGEAPLKPLQEVLPAFLAAQTFGKQTLQPWYGRGW